MLHLCDTILVFGANGQVGSALRQLLGARGKYFTRMEADFTQPEQVKELLDQLGSVPRAIINAAAYTAVDKAETEEALAMRANAETPAIIAEYCKENAIPFIHYSTDYVFPGTGKTPWREEDAPAPLNAYGRSKTAGEASIRAIGGRWLIFRTSWVYDTTGKNFLNTMLRLGRERNLLRVVDDQHGSPTYAPHIARATLDVLEKAIAMPVFPYGIYHLCNSGTTTWHGFAKAIFAGAVRPQVEGIPASAYPSPAIRPHNSRLDCSKLKQVFGIVMPCWKEGLQEAMGMQETQIVAPSC